MGRKAKGNRARLHDKSSNRALFLQLHPRKKQAGPLVWMGGSAAILACALLGTILMVQEPATEVVEATPAMAPEQTVTRSTPLLTEDPLPAAPVLPAPKIVPDAISDPMHELAALPEQPLVAPTPEVPAGVLTFPRCISDLAKQAKSLRIRFDPEGTALSPDAASQIQSLTQELAQCPYVQVLIAGHSDATGDADLNMSLSWSRAEAVLTEMLATAPEIAPPEAIGYGARKAQVSDDPGTKQEQRRVDILISPRLDALTGYAPAQ